MGFTGGLSMAAIGGERSFATIHRGSMPPRQKWPATNKSPLKLTCMLRC
jgi:hypothetical protein